MKLFRLPIFFLKFTLGKFRHRKRRFSVKKCPYLSDGREKAIDVQTVLLSTTLTHPPIIDIAMTTTGENDCLDNVIASLRSSDYPLEKIHLILPSTHSLIEQNTDDFLNTTVLPIDNTHSIHARLHNAFTHRKGDYFLITASNIRFENNTLTMLAKYARAQQHQHVASWEPRQLPTGQPYFYDPIALNTLTPIADCLLINPKAFQSLSKHANIPTLARYFADISAEFIHKGWKTKYCPLATIKGPSKLFSKKANIKMSTPLSVKPLLRFTPLTDQQAPIRNSTPLVSIIMRTYQGRLHALKQAIASVLSQTYQHLEIVVIEDGASTAKGFMQSLSSHFDTPRFNYHNIPKSGRIVTGNVGLKHMQGDFFMFLDDDDFLFADHVETLLNAYYAEKGACTIPYTLAFEVASLPKQKDVSYRIPRQLMHNYSLTKLKEHNLMPIQAPLVSKNIYQTLGGFDESLSCLEDWHLWLKYAEQYEFKFIKKITSCHRVSASFLSRYKIYAMQQNNTGKG